jgi:hypothetical protein
VLPGLQAIATADQVPGAAGLLARVLRLIDPAAAERQMRAALDSAIARGDYQIASTAAGELIDMCRGSGRLGEALTLTNQAISYTRQAELGPWTQLRDEVWRLQVLNEMGRAGEVLAEVQRLRAHMQTLPAERGPNETATPWNVRESLLDAGRSAARLLGRWTDALELNAAVTASRRDRGAPAGEIAQGRFNDYGPFLGLGRIGEALALLLECRQVFETAHDIEMLGKTLSALADVEDKRGHGEAAITLERDALRYKYLAGDVTGIAVSYHNLGSSLRRHARQPDAALACHLAAALIRALAGAARADQSARATADDLRVAGADAGLPADVASLCGQVAGTPGTDLGRLIDALAPGPGTAEQVLGELLALVQNLAAASPAASPHMLAAWDPAIAALLAAAGGDAQAAAALETELDSYQDSPDWSALASALRRLGSGETGPGLLGNLDETDTAIVTRALDAREGKISIPGALWGAVGLGALLGNVVAAADGDAGAAERADQDLQAMAGDPEWSPLVGALRRILGGERDAGLAVRLGDAVQRAVVESVLGHIGAG